METAVGVEIAVPAWTSGHAEGAGTPLELSLADIRSDFEAVEIAAVCQCSGNRRGFSSPHVPGVEWGLGAVGNALWKDARLRDVLERADLRAETVEIVVNGADEPVLDGTPDFVKSVSLAKALDDNTLIAYAMNGDATRVGRQLFREISSISGVTMERRAERSS